MDQFNFSNPTIAEPELSFEDKYELQAIGMMIAFAPVVPFLPIPMTIEYMRHTEIRSGLESFSPGESMADVLEQLGEPDKKLGNHSRTVWFYRDFYFSAGFEDDRLNWLFIGLDATYRPPFTRPPGFRE